jgi:hypothetical protein
MGILPMFRGVALFGGTGIPPGNEWGDGDWPRKTPKGTKQNWSHVSLRQIVRLPGHPPENDGSFFVPLRVFRGQSDLKFEP